MHTGGQYLGQGEVGGKEAKKKLEKGEMIPRRAEKKDVNAESIKPK